MKMPTIGGIFSSPVRKYRKRYCTTPVISVSICGCVRFNTNVKVLCQSDLIFLNPQMDLVYIWYDYRCWSKILLSTSRAPVFKPDRANDFDGYFHVLAQKKQALAPSGAKNLS